MNLPWRPRKVGGGGREGGEGGQSASAGYQLCPRGRYSHRERENRVQKLQKSFTLFRRLSHPYSADFHRMMSKIVRDKLMIYRKLLKIREKEREKERSMTFARFY